jgi:hypothetical protein
MNHQISLGVFLSTVCCLALIFVFALPIEAQTAVQSSSTNDALTRNQDLSKHPIDPQDLAIEQNLNPQAAPSSSPQTARPEPNLSDSVGDQNASGMNQREDADREPQAGDRRISEGQAAGGSEYGNELPRTAGQSPLLVLLGLLSLIAAGGTRLMCAKSSG